MRKWSTVDRFIYLLFSLAVCRVFVAAAIEALFVISLALINTRVFHVKAVVDGIASCVLGYAVCSVLGHTATKGFAWLKARRG